MSAFGGKADIDWARSGVRPLGWTVSCGGFDRLPGVVILVLRGAQITQRGVESAVVVDLVDEAWKVSCNILEGFVGHQIHSFDLECLHEALGLGIIIRIAAPAHGADEAVLS